LVTNCARASDSRCVSNLGADRQRSCDPRYASASDQVYSRLHHPIRQFRDEVKTKMHGFLNVLGGVLAAEHRWNADQAAIMLEDEEPNSFSFTDDFFAWREWKIDDRTAAISPEIRQMFGSCSFDDHVTICARKDSVR